MKHEKSQNKVMSALAVIFLLIGCISIASTTGCSFDMSGLSPEGDAGTDADADVIDADVDADADADAEIPEEICGNDQDDDDDSLVDCADSDCVGFQDPRGFECIASGGKKETACDDQQDNDGDWAEDCDDPDCSNDPACTPNPEICSNGVDDDGDSLIDCEDPNCNGSTGASGEICEIPESTCDDGFDNDGDGLTDCDDPNCAVIPICLESDCSDGVDNNSDGLTDCEAPECDGYIDSTITCYAGRKWEIDCSNGINDDRGREAPPGGWYETFYNPFRNHSDICPYGL